MSGSYVTQTTPFYGRTPITTDAEGNVYLFAPYDDDNLTIGSLDLEDAVGANDAFVVKLNADLEPQWVQPLHNSGENMDTESIIYDSGSLLLTGNFGGDAIFGEETFTSGPYGTGFFSRLDATDGSVDFGLPVGAVTGTGRAVSPSKSGNRIM